MYISFDTMANTKVRELADDSSEMFSEESIWSNPEKHLIATLLQRATEDLKPHVLRSDRLDAINWFLFPLKELPGCWNFFQVCEILDICISRMEVLVKKAVIALRELEKEKLIVVVPLSERPRKKRHDSRN